MEKAYPNVSKEYQRAIEACRGKLNYLITQKHCARGMLIFAYLTADTNWFKAEELRASDNDLHYVGNLLKPIEKQFPILSYADFCQLVGVVAVTSMGGPEIPFHPGRQDKEVPPLESHAVDADNGSDLLGNGILNLILADSGVMGYIILGHVKAGSNPTSNDIVTLSGGVAMGRFRKEHSQIEGPSSFIATGFNNSYYKELLNGEVDGHLEPWDKILMSDPSFRVLVEKYAEDESAFFLDYAKAHLKLSELGFQPNGRPSFWKRIRRHMGHVDWQKLMAAFGCIGLQVANLVTS